MFLYTALSLYSFRYFFAMIWIMLVPVLDRTELFRPFSLKATDNHMSPARLLLRFLFKL